MKNGRELGRILKSERERRGLSIYAICKNRKLVHHQVEGFEKGTRGLSVDSVFEYLKALNLDMQLAER